MHLSGKRSEPVEMAEIDAVIDRALDEQRIVGTVVIASRSGRIVHQRSAGWANRELKVEMRDTSLFRLASVSKLVLTLATMRLVEEGCVSLSDRITKWLPDFKPLLRDGNAPEITVHHLLTHTAGLSYRFSEPLGSHYHMLGISDGLDIVSFDLEENLRRISRAPLAFAPGTRWRYSVSIDVLGAIVSRAVGLSLPDAILQLVSRPLGLQSLAFSVPPDTPLATPYVNGLGAPHIMAESETVCDPEDPAVAIRFAPNRAFDKSAFPSGGAGMVGSAADVYALLEALRPQSGKYLTHASVQTLGIAYVGADAQTQGAGWGFGYGGGILTDPKLAGSPQSAGTIQWGGVYGHYWFVDTMADIAVLALTNTTWEGAGGQFTKELRNAAYAEA